MKRGHIGSGVGGLGAQGWGAGRTPGDLLAGIITHHLPPNQACWVKPQEEQRGPWARDPPGTALPLENPDPPVLLLTPAALAEVTSHILCTGTLPRPGLQHQTSDSSEFSGQPQPGSNTAHCAGPSREEPAHYRQAATPWATTSAPFTQLPSRSSHEGPAPASGVKAHLGACPSA